MKHPRKEPKVPQCYAHSGVEYRVHASGDLHSPMRDKLLKYEGMMASALLYRSGHDRCVSHITGTLKRFNDGRWEVQDTRANYIAFHESWVSKIDHDGISSAIYITLP